MRIFFWKSKMHDNFGTEQLLPYYFGITILVALKFCFDDKKKIVELIWNLTFSRISSTQASNFASVSMGKPLNFKPTFRSFSKLGVAKSLGFLNLIKNFTKSLVPNFDSMTFFHLMLTHEHLEISVESKFSKMVTKISLGISSIVTSMMLKKK